MINDINQQTMTKSVFLSILLWIFIYPLRVRAIESINFIHIGVNEGLSQTQYSILPKTNKAICGLPLMTD